jgi:hypothetical protein
MVSNSVQWQRQENGKLELFVYESDQRWKLYTQSKNFVPDSLVPGASRGFETFRKCIKEGYKIIPTQND